MEKWKSGPYVKPKIEESVERQDVFLSFFFIRGILLMSAIYEVSNYFRDKLEQKNTKILMEAIFPQDGEVVDRGKVKGEISRLGWKIKPEIWWDVRCNQTKKCYHIHFKIVETAIGDIYYFWNGKAFQNFTFVLNEENLRNAIIQFIQGDNFHNLIRE